MWLLTAVIPMQMFSVCQSVFLIETKLQRTFFLSILLYLYNLFSVKIVVVFNIYLALFVNLKKHPVNIMDIILSLQCIIYVNEELLFLQWCYRVTPCLSQNKTKQSKLTEWQQASTCRKNSLYKRTCVISVLQFMNIQSQDIRKRM